MNVVIFGPPGAGKGTQAQNIVKKFHLHQVSTGDLLRNEVKKKTSIGKDIENIISKGDFATDEIVNELIKKVVFDTSKKNKLIFDGYPRSLNQAENLDILLKNSNQKIDYIFFLNVKKDTIVKRIEKRKILEKRADDIEEVAVKRYHNYEKNINPVINFYKQTDLLKVVDGEASISKINDEIRGLIEGIKG